MPNLSYAILELNSTGLSHYKHVLFVLYFFNLILILLGLGLGLGLGVLIIRDMAIAMSLFSLQHAGCLLKIF